MKNISLILGALLALSYILPAKTLVNVDHSGVGIRGYDPVAYFKEGKAEKGLSKYRSSADGVTYLFNSTEDKAPFDANPLKYAPQFGGYCAYGVSRGSLVDIDPSAVQIVNVPLLLQYSRRIMEKFKRNQSMSLQKAESNWPILVEKKGK